jgi:hypothetical protein
LPLHNDLHSARKPSTLGRARNPIVQKADAFV